MGKEQSAQRVLHTKELEAEIILAYSQTSVTVAHIGSHWRKQQSPHPPPPAEEYKLPKNKTSAFDT